MLGICYTVRLVVVLVVGCCLALGQPIDVHEGASCTYSFAVQSRLCTRDPGSKAEVAALHENVDQLRNQIAQMDREISTMKHGSGKSAKYVYLGGFNYACKGLLYYYTYHLITISNYFDFTYLLYNKAV